MPRLKENVMAAIIDHCREEMPFEACGYLAEKNGIVETSVRMINTDKAADHFSMDPAEQFAAVKTMRAAGQSLIGIYHSHPETPARPSAEDIRLAYDQGLSYVIVSLAEPEQVVVKSFRIHQQEVLTEVIEVVVEPEDKEKP